MYLNFSKFKIIYVYIKSIMTFIYGSVISLVINSLLLNI